MNLLRTARLLALTVPLIAAGCAGGWHQLKSKRITGYAERPGDYRETMRQLEYSYAALSAFFPRADVGPVEVLFLPPATWLHTFGAERTGLVLTSVPGAGRVGRQSLVVMSQQPDYLLSTRLLAHLFLNKAVPGAPLWLHQSLAAYLGTAAIQSGQGRWRACFGFHASLDSRLYQMPLDKFFAVTWEQYPEAGPGFFIGTGRLLMDYIFHGEKGAHLPKLPAIFSAAGQGMRGPDIMAATFPGVSLEELGKRISDFKGSQTEQRERGLICPLPVPIDAAHIPDESDPQESPFPTPDIEQLMAALKKLPHGDRFPAWYPPP
jgi:hypothetical protein